MASGGKLEQSNGAEDDRRGSRDAQVGHRVMLALGRPDDLCRVQARELWEGRYRVNVYVGPDVASAQLAHSFFLVTDDSGNIIQSMPRIKRLYDTPAGPPPPSMAAEAVTRG